MFELTLICCSLHFPSASSEGVKSDDHTYGAMIEYSSKGDWYMGWGYGKNSQKRHTPLLQVRRKWGINKDWSHALQATVIGNYQYTTDNRPVRLVPSYSVQYKNIVVSGLATLKKTAILNLAVRW